jgi:hypothetical protein
MSRRTLRLFSLVICGAVAVVVVLGCMMMWYQVCHRKEALTEKSKPPGEKSLDDYHAHKKEAERIEQQKLEEERNKPPSPFMDPINAATGECPDGYVFKDRASITTENGSPTIKYRVCVLAGSSPAAASPAPAAASPAVQDPTTSPNVFALY